MTKLFGGIEAGGTKFVCAIGTAPDDVRAETRFPTTTPSETLQRAIDFFRDQTHREKIAALGIASFGPIDLHTNSPTFGAITTTPKPGWANTNIVGALRAALNVPIAFDTDVNGAALAEQSWGAAQGLQNFIYLTIGTGIGGGAMVNGELLHGLIHPEMGHLFIPHDLSDDPFPGVCPFHRDCFEGLASGPAIEKRWSARGEDLPPDHAAWKLEAHYIASAVANLICALSPQRIILGGGVMEHAHLYERVRERILGLLNGYIGAKEITAGIEKYIAPPTLGKQAGVLGAIALAEKLTRG